MLTGFGATVVEYVDEPEAIEFGKAKTPGANVWPPRLRFRPRQ